MKVAVLNEQLLLAREAIRNLTESLALANSEVEIFKRQAEEQQSKLEALAPLPSGGDLKEKLLAMSSDLKHSETENAELIEKLLGLSESVQVFLKTVETSGGGEFENLYKDLQERANDNSDMGAQAEAKSLLAVIQQTITKRAEARAAIETELRKVNKILGHEGIDVANDLDGAANVASLTDASVVEVKPEFALIVANVGRTSGARVGMPFQVWRGNWRIGEVRIIDVREQFSGAVVQNLVSEDNTIQVGDRLRVDARR